MGRGGWPVGGGWWWRVTGAGGQWLHGAACCTTAAVPAEAQRQPACADHFSPSCGAACGAMHMHCTRAAGRCCRHARHGASVQCATAPDLHNGMAPDTNPLIAAVSHAGASRRRQAGGTAPAKPPRPTPSTPLGAPRHAAHSSPDALCPPRPCPPTTQPSSAGVLPGLDLSARARAFRPDLLSAPHQHKDTDQPASQPASLLPAASLPALSAAHLAGSAVSRVRPPDPGCARAARSARPVMRPRVTRHPVTRHPVTRHTSHVTRAPRRCPLHSPRRPST